MIKTTKTLFASDLAKRSWVLPSAHSGKGPVGLSDPVLTEATAGLEAWGSSLFCMT